MSSAPSNFIERVTERLLDTDPRRRRDILLVAAVAWLGIAALEWITSYELSLSTLYLVVICAAAWAGGWRWGLACALLSVANQTAVGFVLGHPFSRPGDFGLVSFNRFFAEVLIAGLVAGLRALFERERSHARIDYLTGALNRAGFDEALAVELARHRRDGDPFALAYFDCDDFKAFNDRRGHRFGNLLLQRVVQTFKRCLRKTDVIARLGNDQFAVLLPKTGAAEAESVTQELLYALKMAAAAEDFVVTFNIAVGVFPQAPESESAVLSFTEGLLNRLKSEGKSGFLVETCRAGASGSPSEHSPPPAPTAASTGTPSTH